MPWPAEIICFFESVSVNPSETEFHGPYNSLLYTLFSPDDAFMFALIPRYSTRHSDYYTFTVLEHRKPVFYLEVRAPSDLHYLSKREGADRQIRARMTDLSGMLQSHLVDAVIDSASDGYPEECAIPVLRAVSAFGTKLCFFSKQDGQDIQPAAIPAHPELQTDTAPRERWNYDLLEAEGEQKFREMVEQIKEDCAILHMHNV